MSPDRLAGWLCPPCSEAVDSAGAIGQTAMANALAAHLRSNGRETDAERLRTADPRLVGRGLLAPDGGGTANRER